MHQSLQKGCLTQLVNSFSQTEGMLQTCRELLDLSKEKEEGKRGNNNIEVQIKK